MKYLYKMMLADLEEYPNKIKWAYLVKDYYPGWHYAMFD